MQSLGDTIVFQKVNMDLCQRKNKMVLNVIVVQLLLISLEITAFS